MRDAAAANYRVSNKRTLQLGLWTLAWAATLAVARFGPELLWDAQPVPTWTAVVANVLVGIAWIVAFARFLRAQDDLWRKINLDALAVTLGAGFVGGFGYFVADAARLVSHDFDLALFPALLGIVYVVAIIVGWIKYR